MKTTSGHWTWLRVALRWIGGIIGWASLLLVTLLTGFLSGWVMLAATRLRSLLQDKVLYTWLVLLAITAGLAWLVARFTPARIVGWVVGSTLALMLVIWIGWSWRYPRQKNQQTSLFVRDRPSDNLGDGEIEPAGNRLVQIMGLDWKQSAIA